MAVSTKERVLGGMLGLTAGDALGVLVEFCTREELDADPVVDMRSGGTSAFPS